MKLDNVKTAPILAAPSSPLLRYLSNGTVATAWHIGQDLVVVELVVLAFDEIASSDGRYVLAFMVDDHHSTGVYPLQLVSQHKGTLVICIVCDNSSFHLDKAFGFRMR